MKLLGVLLAVMVANEANEDGEKPCLRDIQTRVAQHYHEVLPKYEGDHNKYFQDHWGSEMVFKAQFNVRLIIGWFKNTTEEKCANCSATVFLMLPGEIGDKLFYNCILKPMCIAPEPDMEDICYQYEQENNTMGDMVSRVMYSHTNCAFAGKCRHIPKIEQ